MMRRLVFALAVTLGALGVATPLAAQTLAVPLNNARTTLGADHAIGSGTLTVKTGKGALFGTVFPIRVTVAQSSTLSSGLIVDTTTQTIFMVSGRSGDTLTGCTPTEGTSDHVYGRNDPIAALVTAGTIADLHAAITANTAAIAAKPDAGAFVTITGNQQIAGQKTLTSRLASTLPNTDQNALEITPFGPDATKTRTFRHGAYTTANAGVPLDGLPLGSLQTSFIGWRGPLDGGGNLTFPDFVDGWESWWVDGAGRRVHERHIASTTNPTTSRVTRPITVQVDLTNPALYTDQVTLEAGAFNASDHAAAGARDWLYFSTDSAVTPTNTYRFIYQGNANDICKITGNGTTVGLTLGWSTQVTTLTVAGAAGTAIVSPRVLVRDATGGSTVGSAAGMVESRSTNNSLVPTYVSYCSDGTRALSTYAIPGGHARLTTAGILALDSGQFLVRDAAGANNFLIIDTSIGDVAIPSATTGRLFVGSASAGTSGGRIESHGISSQPLFVGYTSGGAVAFTVGPTGTTTLKGNLTVGANGALAFSDTGGGSGRLVVTGIYAFDVGLFYVRDATGANIWTSIDTSNGATVFNGSVAIGGGTPIAKVLSAAATLDFPSTAAGTSSELSVTVTGAAVGDPVSLGLPAAPDANTSYSGYVSGANTVKVRFNNYSAGAIDPASASFRPMVSHF
jgi:hypothetical protein